MVLQVFELSPEAVCPDSPCANTGRSLYWALLPIVTGGILFDQNFVSFYILKIFFEGSGMWSEFNEIFASWRLYLGRGKQTDSDCSRVVIAVDKGGVEGRQRLLRREGTKYYHLGYHLSGDVKKIRSIHRDSYRKMVWRAKHHTGPCLYIVWRSDSQAIDLREGSHLAFSTTPNKGLGYANVALLLLYNYGDHFGRGVNSDSVTEQP